jgi:hypothetical protein
MARKRRRGFAAHLDVADEDWALLRQNVRDYADAVEATRRAIAVIYPDFGHLLIATAAEIATWRGQPPAVESQIDHSSLFGGLDVDVLADLCSPDAMARASAALDEILRTPLDLSELFTTKEADHEH